MWMVYDERWILNIGYGHRDAFGVIEVVYGASFVLD